MPAMISRSSLFAVAVFAVCGGFLSNVACGQSTICARVVIQIEQELTLEREGFEARLGVTNGLPSALENFRVTLKFTDADGNAVAVATDSESNANARFYYRVQTGYAEPGSVAAGATRQVAYLIVPTIGAAGTDATGALYYVGATIKYVSAGEEQTVEVAADSITVRPMPELQLQYFLPGDVYGDDPLTPSVTEPVVPFKLGVRVINHSAYATARKVKIQSGQPEIIENEQGLLIDFRIIGSEVNGSSAAPSLLTDFGDIAPRRAGVADWLMTSSLSGRFVKFTAEVSHAPEFGGALTSLIAEDAVSTHRLLGQVLVDLPGRDTIPDFLATDVMTGDVINPKAYESDNDEVSTSVDYYSPGNPVVQLSPLASAGAARVCTLTVDASAALIYVHTASPLADDKVVRAVRSDGKVLPAQNSWISKTKTEDGPWLYWLHLFDTNKEVGHAYTLTFTDLPEENRAPVLTLVNGRSFTVRPGRAVSIRVAATDPDGVIPMLSTGALPDGATFTDVKDGSGTLTWTPSVDQAGAYVIQFRASDGVLTVAESAHVVVDPTAVSGFEAWQERYWPGIADPGIIGPQADPDGDRLDNLLEYALDADPTVADDSLLPKIGIERIDDQRYLTLTYRKRTDDPTLVYEVVASDNLHAPLDSWEVQTEVLASEPLDLGSGLRIEKVRDSQPVEAASVHRYLRLRVTRTETP